MKRRAKLAAGIFGVLSGVVLLFFWNRSIETVVSLDLHSSADTFAQLYFDSGHGFDETHSRKVDVKANPPGVFQPLRFVFRTRQLRGLRLDPAVVPGRFVVLNARAAVSERDLFRLSPRDVLPEHDLAACIRSAESLACETTANASDPQFSLRLPHDFSHWKLALTAYGNTIGEIIGLLALFTIGAVLATSDKAIAWMRQLQSSRAVHLLLKPKFFYLVASTFLLLVLRRPDVLYKPQLWAEDAVVFFREDVRLGFWHALVMPYAGYLHAIPRLIAGIAIPVPARFVPAFFNLAALGIEALSCSCFFLPWCRTYIRSDRIRAALCVILACAIPTGHELVGTISNVQWWLVIPGVLLMVWRPTDENRWTVWAAAAAGLLIALSAALLVIVTPFVLVRSVLDRRLPPAPAAFTFLGTVIQGAVGLHEMSVHSSQAAAVLDVLKAVVAAWLSRPVLQTLFGESFVRSASDRELAIWMITALFVSAIGFAVLLVMSEGSKRLTMLGALYLAAASLSLVILGRQFVTSFVTMDGWRNFLGQRYFFFPSAIFILLVGIIVQRLCAERTVLGVFVLAALFANGMIRNFHSPEFADLQWPVYAAKIDRWKEEKSTGKPIQRLDVPINPIPWILQLN